MTKKKVVNKTAERPHTKQYVSRKGGSVTLPKPDAKKGEDQPGDDDNAG